MSRADAEKALELVRGVIAAYLPPDSGITAHEALSRIIRIVETGSSEPGPTLLVIDGAPER